MIPVFRQQPRTITAIVLLSCGALSCTRREVVEIPEPSAATVRVVSVTPAPGSVITAETTIVVELEYWVEQFEPKRFKAGATARQIRDGYSWSLVPTGGKESDMLPAAAGRVRVAFGAKTLWEKPDLVRPFEITFSVDQLVGSWGASVMAAKAEPVVFRPTSPNR